MTFKFSAAVLASACWLLFLVSPPSGHCAADAVFVYELKTDDAFTGEKEAVMVTAFSPQAMYLDVQTRYIGSWMKRIFGKVTESRETTHFLLNERQVREVNWHRNNVRVFPIDKIADVGWVTEKSTRTAEAEDIVKDRYTIVPPQFEITNTGVQAVINGFDATRIDTFLQMETHNKKNNSTSITQIRQELWVSRNLPQYQVYQAFFGALADQLGLEAERLKSLSYVLQYWQGSLDPIRDKLIAIEGLPVKSVTSVEAVYVKNVGSPKSETMRKQIKTETVLLKSAQTASPDMKYFDYPDYYPLVHEK
jgi:hypothetical protein